MNDVFELFSGDNLSGGRTISRRTVTNTDAAVYHNRKGLVMAKRDRLRKKKDMNPNVVGLRAEMVVQPSLIRSRSTLCLTP